MINVGRCNEASKQKYYPYLCDMKNFEIGQRVVLIHTGVIAKIIRPEDHDMVIVELEDDATEIPVFKENIQLYEQWMSRSKTFSTADDFVPFVSEKVIEEALLFVLVPTNVSEAGVPAKYELILVNATAYDLYTEIDVLFEGVKELTISERIKAFSPLKVDEFTPLEFGDKPSVNYLFQRITTSGVEDFKIGILKLKDKTLLKAKMMIPLLDFPAIGIHIWQKGSKPQKTGASLKDYTKDFTAYRPKVEPPKKKVSGLYDPLKLANFPIEIDLHIEQLAQNHAQLAPAQIIQIQLRAMEQFVNEAFDIGMDSVFLIHGVGKGYLRKAIHKRLKYHPHILSVKNEYHSKYGHGATEVIFL